MFRKRIDASAKVWDISENSIGDDTENDSVFEKRDFLLIKQNG